MLQRLLRLICTAGLAVLAYFIAVKLGCDPYFFIMPCVLSFLHMLLWDLFKCKFLDLGFFRFLKFIAFVAAFVFLVLLTVKHFTPMVSAEYFSLESTATDLQRQTVGGAIGILSFAFVLCIGCVQSFPNRWVGLGVPVLSIVLGVLYGFLPAFFAFFTLGLGKVFAYAILLLPIAVLFAYMMYRDLGFEDAFAGLGLEKLRSRSRGGGGTMTAEVRADAEGPAPTWQDWQYIAKRHSSPRSLSYGSLYVDVQYSHGSRYVDFYIDGQYDIGGITDQYQAENVAGEVRGILADVQQSVFDDASSTANGHVKVTVRVRNVRAR